MFIVPYGVLLAPTDVVMWPTNPNFAQYRSLLSVLCVTVRGLCFFYGATYGTYLFIHSVPVCPKSTQFNFRCLTIVAPIVWFKTVLCSTFSYIKLSRHHRVTMVTMAILLAQHCTRLQDKTSQLMDLQHLKLFVCHSTDRRTTAHL